MTNQMMIVLSNYDERITFLRSEGDQLLQSIQSLEIGDVNKIMSSRLNANSIHCI